MANDGAGVVILAAVLGGAATHWLVVGGWLAHVFRRSPQRAHSRDERLDP